MAVDSLAKRFGMMALGRGPNVPHPDGTIAAFDRATLLWLYGGIPISSGVVSGPYSIAEARTFIAGPQEVIGYIAGSQETVGYIAGSQETIGT